MSRAHRAARRRSAREAARHAPRQHFDHQHEWVATNTGWCELEESLPQIRQSTHDALIELLGGARRSGVRWAQFTGDDALAHMETLIDGCRDQALLDTYREIRGLLREHGGWVVTAMADASRR